MGLSDKNLNYLMSSDFTTEDLSNERLIELLKEFKYFYRLQHGRLNSIMFEIDKLKMKIENQDCKMKDLELKLIEAENKIEINLNHINIL